MSKRDGRMWVAQRLVKKSDSNIGLPVQIADEDCAGCLFAFWTKKAARERYGRGVPLIEIRVAPRD